MSDEKKPNHKLNLSRIQPGDFEIMIVGNDEINPTILFRDELARVIWIYHLTIQSGSWLSEGGKWPKTETYHISREDIIVFTFEGFKESLEKNKNRLILSDNNGFSVPLTPQEVYKIIQSIEAHQKDTAERKAKEVIEREAAAKRHEEYLKEYNEKMNNLRQERQKSFENQENAV